MTTRASTWWVLLSAATAPVLLIGGWTVAATQQRHGFAPMQDTISALAALEARDRWIMTSALYGLGVCHVLTAWGLRPAATRGRGVLAFGGLCTLFVASLPLSKMGSPNAHLTAATGAFVSLATWPLFAFERTPETPTWLRPKISVAAAAVLLALLGALELSLRRQSYVGLSERTAAGAQALWPLVVAFATRPRPRDAL